MPLKLKAFYKNIKKIVSYIKAPTIAIPPALYAFFISIFRFLRDYTLRIFSIASKRLTKRLTIALFVFIITFFIFVLFLFNRDLFNFTDVTKNRLFNVFFVFPH